MVNPTGGSYSCRLGDGTGTNYGAARMTQTFMVTPANMLFTYSYAVIIQSPAGHSLNQQPYFSVRVYDQNNNNVTCGSYSVTATGTTTDFTTTTYSGEALWYKDWTTVFAPLQSYVGQNVTIEFTTGDCGQGGHFGYAYIDASCAGDSITPSATAICSGNPVTLTAPAGASAYLWSNGQTTQQITVTSGGVYTVTMTPVSGSACNIVLDVTIGEDPNPTAIFTANPTTICQGQTINFTDASTVPSPGTIATWQWDFGDGISSPSSSGNVTGVSQTTGTYTGPSHVYNITGNFNVALTVETPSGCQSTVSHPIVVSPGPTIAINGPTSVCSGGSITLTASGASTYTWDNGITNGVAFAPPNGTTTYNVTGTSVSGCEGTQTITVTTNPIPLPTITGNIHYCTGQPPILDAGTGYSGYLWSNGTTTETGTFSAADNPITVTVTTAAGCQSTSTPFNLIEDPAPVTNASYQICQGASMVIHGITETTSGVYTQSFSTGAGCDSTSTITLTVNPIPTVDAGLDQTVCQGSSVTLNGSGASTYTWDNGVPNGIAFTQSIGTTTYTVTGTDINGCINTDQVNITVDATPPVDAGPDQVVCIGTQVTLTATGATTYNWDNGVTNGTPFTPAVGSVTYTITGTSASCISTDQVIVTVNPLPTVSAGNDFTICDGVTAVLTGSGAATYTWDNSVTNGVNFHPSTTNTYTVIGTDINGCINTDNTTITVIPIPVVDFTGNNLDGCSPLTPDFTNNSTGNLVNCKWTFSDGQSLTGCGNVSATFVNVGCYDVILTVTTPEGCTNTLTKSNYICVEPNPVADFHANPDKLSTINWTTTMVNTSTDATTYHWIFGDGTGSSSAFEPTHDFPHDGPGTYNIKLFVTSAFGCVDSTSRTIVVTDDLIFYVPNTFTPDNDDFNETFKPVFATGYDPYNYTLYIFDRWGEILFESHNVDVGWDGTYGGKLVQDGTYVWKIIVKRKSIDKHEEHVGHVNVLK